MEHIINEEWSIPRCGTGFAHAAHTWACSLSSDCRTISFSLAMPGHHSIGHLSCSSVVSSISPINRIVSLIVTAARW